MQFSVDDVRAVARLLKESSLAEISIETTTAAQPSRLLVRRAPAPPLVSPAPHGATTNGPGDTQHHTPAAAATSDGNNGYDIEAGREPALISVKSPAVGLFRSVEPELKIGDRVRVGQVVGTVESLKVPNEVGSPIHGEVIEILVEEGQGVEYGQPLVVLRPESAMS